MKYSFAAITLQHLCCQTSTHFMVHSYYRNFFSQISVKRNNRLMNFRILTFIQRRHSRNYPIYNMSVQQIQIFSFSLYIFQCVT